jgi:hypothetical protein
MRIPTNSNFSRELSKKFEKIFNREMYLDDIKLKDLQEHIDSLPVDTHSQKQVSKIKEKANGQETSKVANAVRQVHNERKGFVTKTVSTKGKKESYSLETAPN